MIPASFDYVRPATLGEAVQALVSAGEDGKIITGGQSLLPLLRTRLAAPSVLVDCGQLPEMRGITVDDSADGGVLVIGADMTHHEVETDPLVAEHAPLLARTAATVADPQIRHRGTLGGSLAHADPAGDLPTAALVLDCVLVAEGPNGIRHIPAAEFFVDYFTSALSFDEVLIAVRVPILGPGWGVHYQKFHRVAQSWAMVGVAVAVRLNRSDPASRSSGDNGSVAEARVGLTNMNPTPVRATGVESALAGADASAGAIAAACESAADGTNPTSDIHAQADYRRHLARVITARAVLAAAGSE
jgi:aerobic carbon-monoxide dehydrogenase medium subunit